MAARAGRRANDDVQALDIHLQRDAVRLDDFAWARQLSDEGLKALINRLITCGRAIVC